MMPNSTLCRQTAEYLLQATRFTGLDIHWWLNRMVLAIFSKLNGQLRQQWTSTQMLLVYTAGGRGLLIRQMGLYMTVSRTCLKRHNNYDKNFTPLLQQSTHGDTFSKGRKYYYIVTTSRYTIYGKMGTLGNRRS